MLPKDLLKDLEKGDRTKEVMSEKPKGNIGKSDEFSNFQQLASAQLAQQVRVQQQTMAQSVFGVFPNTFR